MILHFSKKASPGSFSDEELRIAAQAVRNSMIKSLEEDLEPHHAFSESFLRRMQELLCLDKRRSQRKRLLQHAAVFLVGIILTGALFLAFNPNARADFANWMRSIYENSILYEFFSKQENSEDDVQQMTIPDIEFTWLPGEYEITELFNSGERRNLLLTNENDSIFLNYWLTDSENYLEVFTDGYEKEQVAVNGEAADAYTSLDPESSNALVWMNANRTIVFELTTMHTTNTMVKIAEGISEK